MAKSPNALPAAAAANLLTGILTSISIAIQNCNSLNISTNCPKQTKKIRAITDLGTDIILLSDIRLADNIQSKQDLEKAFLFSSSNCYKLIYNSSRNSRGTGILYKSKLDIVINYTHKDDSENLLCTNICLNGQVLNLISIYGPNNNVQNKK